jgi:glutathione synthase/RimK-type ligase-like ATP-grasp enzyme
MFSLGAASNPTVAIASFAEKPDLRADDAFLREALEAAGICPVPVVWDDESVAWSEFDACLIRSVSDYHLKQDSFLNWLQRLPNATQVWNEPDLVAWNTDKSYLLQLSSHGVPIIPTYWLEQSSRVELAGLLEDCGWNDVVLKPTVGLAAQRLLRVDGSRDEDQAGLDDLLADFGVMAQPFLPSVVERGETSLVFIEGELTHTVRKRAGEGDFRVQRCWGGTSALCQPTADELEVADRTMALLGTDPIFARIDVVEGPDGPCLIELELIEPDLFFREMPAAARRLAAAIATTLRH